MFLREVFVCLRSKWQLNSLDKRSQEGTGLRQSISRQVISTTTPSLRHLFPETAWQCPLKLFLVQYFGMWSSEGGQAMCQKRGGAVLKPSRHYLSEQSAVFAKKRVISRPKLSTTNPIFASLGNPSRGCSDSISRFMYDLGSKEVV